MGAAGTTTSGEPELSASIRSSNRNPCPFLNPIAHIPNLTANWLVERGVSVANPLIWGRDFKAGVKAFNAVAHQNQDFLEALDAGAPLQSQKSAVRQFSDLLIKKLQDEAQEPSVAEKL